jgi:hypothetical protein
MTEQHWTPESPCTSCGSVSNTGHSSWCPNAGLYDEDGNAIPAVSEQPTYINIGPEAFTDGLAISYKGEIYYKSCDALVVENNDGSSTHCVKRVNHPKDHIHEDYEGNVREVHEDGMGYDLILVEEQPQPPEVVSDGDDGDFPAEG